MALAIFEFAHITGRATECILHVDASCKNGSPRWFSLAIFEFAHITGRAIECIHHGGRAVKMAVQDVFIDFRICPYNGESYRMYTPW